MGTIGTNQGGYSALQGVGWFWIIFCPKPLDPNGGPPAKTEENSKSANGGCQTPPVKTEENSSTPRPDYFLSQIIVLGSRGDWLPVRQSGGELFQEPP